jgi:hypothetical protein
MERPAPRQLQQVSTLATRKSVITWMVQDESINGNVGLYVYTIQAFLSISEARRLQMLWEPLIGGHAETNSATKTRMQIQPRHFLALRVILGIGNECAWRLPLVMEQNT